MTEQVYHGKRLENPIILKEGTYDGYDYLIITLGTHPCSYIKLPPGHKYHGQHYDDIPLECHGGLTFARSKIMGKSTGDWIIGWDYAHLGDRLAYTKEPNGLFSGHEWTVQELTNEMEQAIKHLKEISTQ